VLPSAAATHKEKGLGLATSGDSRMLTSPARRAKAMLFPSGDQVGESSIAVAGASHTIGRSGPS